MADCCEDIVNLGCVGMCDAIVTGLTADETGTYIISTIGGGGFVSLEFTEGAAINFTNPFNEDSVTIFTVKNPSGEVMDIEGAECFQVSVKAGISLTQTECEMRNYKVYKALLNQTGTNAPVSTIVQNELSGDISYSYISAGMYKGTLAGAFTIGKTIQFLTNTGTGVGYTVQILNNGVNEFIIQTDNGVTGANGILQKASILIEVHN